MIHTPLADLKTDLESLKVTIQTLSDQIKEISTNQPSLADAVKSKSIPSSSKSSSQPLNNSPVAESQACMKKAIQSEIMSFNRKPSNPKFCPSIEGHVMSSCLG